MRRAYVPLMADAYLHGFAAGLSRTAKQQGNDARVEQFPRSVYATILQAGVDRVLTSTATGATLPPQLASRFETSTSKEEFEILLHVKSIFDSAGVANGGNGEQRWEVQNLQNFVAALFGALPKRAHLVWTSGLPQPDKLEHLVPPTILLPIKNLLSCATSIQPTVLVPRLEVKREELLLLDEILSASAFTSYVASHGRLDDATKAIQPAVDTISKTALRMSRINKFLLRHASVAGAVIEAGTKQLDSFSKFPGAIADLLAKILAQMLQDRTRLVIYDVQLPMHDIARISLKR